MKQVVIDWKSVSDIGGFYDLVLPQTGAPDWHGHNLNAINDAWVTGDICKEGPPFDFVTQGDPSSPDVKSFKEAVDEIIKRSVKENGGSVRHELS